MITVVAYGMTQTTPTVYDPTVPSSDAPANYNADDGRVYLAQIIDKAERTESLADYSVEDLKAALAVGEYSRAAGDHILAALERLQPNEVAAIIAGH